MIDIQDAITWLDKGAPHVIFNMDYAFIPLEDLDGRQNEDQIDDKPDCGSVCCIAGYLTFLDGMTQEEADLTPWRPIQDRVTQQAAAALRLWVTNGMELEFSPRETADVE